MITFCVDASNSKKDTKGHKPTNRSHGKKEPSTSTHSFLRMQLKSQISCTEFHFTPLAPFCTSLVCQRDSVNNVAGLPTMDLMGCFPSYHTSYIIMNKYHTVSYPPKFQEKNMKKKTSRNHGGTILVHAVEPFVEKSGASPAAPRGCAAAGAPALPSAFLATRCHKSIQFL